MYVCKYPNTEIEKQGKGKIVVVEFYFKLRFIWYLLQTAFCPHFLKLETQFVMYYKLRCFSTQFAMYYKLRNYYKVQRNNAP